MKKIRLIIDIEAQVVEGNGAVATDSGKPIIPQGELFSAPQEKVPPKNPPKVSPDSLASPGDTTDSSSSTAVLLQVGNGTRQRSPASACDDCRRLVNYFNEMTGKKCRAVESTVKLMHARHHEYSVRDCARVIRYKVLDWFDDPDTRAWVNLETLFRPSKFDKYLNEIPSRQMDLTDPDVKRLIELGIIKKEAADGAKQEP